MAKSRSVTKHRLALLDSLAVSMSMLCAIHCMITPLLLIMLPVIGTSFWVHKDFHLWMLLLVLPTTTAALFFGCRKHKDRSVALLALAGLALLVSVALYESLFHSGLSQEHAHCAHCAQRSAGFVINNSTVVNLVGAFLLSCGHVRNYLLCRRADCCHD